MTDERRCYHCKHKYVDVDQWCLRPESDHERLGMSRTYEARYSGQPCGPEGKLFESKEDNHEPLRADTRTD